MKRSRGYSGNAASRSSVIPSTTNSSSRTVLIPKVNNDGIGTPGSILPPATNSIDTTSDIIHTTGRTCHSARADERGAPAQERNGPP